MNYFIFVALFFTAINPFWTDRIKLLGAGKKIFLLKNVTDLKLCFPVWQSVIFISLTGLLLGRSIMLCTTLSKYVAFLTGFSFIWTTIFANLFILHWWTPRYKHRSKIKHLFSILAASSVLAGILLSSLLTIAIRNTPIFMTGVTLLAAYHIVTLGKALSASIPNLVIGRAMAGELIALIVIIATTGAIAYWLCLDFSSFLIIQQ